MVRGSPAANGPDGSASINFPTNKLAVSPYPRRMHPVGTAAGTAPAVAASPNCLGSSIVAAPALKTPRLVTAYRRYLGNADSLRYAHSVNDYYTPATLAKLLQLGGTELRRAASLALGVAGDGSSIEALGRALSDADRGVRLAADDSFRALLIRDAAPLHHQQLLQVMHLNDGGEYAAALPPTMILTDQAPLYAEAHHQLGVCWQGLDHPVEAEAAFRGCLWLCRFHYPAWLGLARCQLASGDLSAALRSLERSLAICPDLETARIQARALRRRLGRTEPRG